MPATQDIETVASNTSKAKKKKKSKKKPGPGKEQAEGPTSLSEDPATLSEDEDGEQLAAVDTTLVQRASADTTGNQAGIETAAVGPLTSLAASAATNNGTPQGSGSSEPDPSDASLESKSDSASRLDALVKERDDLKAEVVILRKSLEGIQARHVEKTDASTKELEEVRSSKDHWEQQYNQLLERVNTIRSQLGERLKADRAEIAQAQSQIEELEEQNRITQESNESLQSQLSSATTEREKQAKELSELRGRANLSQQNWVKERDELISREAYAREEYETAKQAMQDWEILAMEERTLRQNLSDRVGEIEEQLHRQQEGYEKVCSERDNQAQSIEGLQRALRDIQEARKKELRELVENSQSQLDELRKQKQAAEDAATTSSSELKAAQRELERALPFEKEVKEKNLLIGKLRHEAVILNDHLTKALRFLKQRKPEDMVDRQLVTNFLLQFLALDRSDPKKFQILQLIAALLAWSDEQKEQAGLSRPGGPTSSSNTSLRVSTMSPFRRTPSQPSISPGELESPRGGSKESLAELWSDFLEREAQEGQRSRGGSKDITSPVDRKPSVSSG